MESAEDTYFKRSKSASTRIGGRIIQRRRGISKMKNRSTSRKKIVEKSSSALKKKIMIMKVKDQNNDHETNQEELVYSEDPKKLKRMRMIELNLRKHKPRTQINLEKRLKGFVKEIAGIDESIQRMKQNFKSIGRFHNGANNEFFLKMLQQSFNELKTSRDHFINQYKETQLEYNPVPEFSFFTKKRLKMKFENSQLKQKSVSSNEEKFRENDSIYFSTTNESMEMEESVIDSKDDTHSARTSLMAYTTTSVDEDSDSSMIALSEYYSGDSVALNSMRDACESKITNLEVIPEHDSEASSDKGSKEGDS